MHRCLKPLKGAPKWIWLECRLPARLGLLARVGQSLVIVLESDHRSGTANGPGLVDRSQQGAVFGGRTAAKVVCCAGNQGSANLPPALARGGGCRGNGIEDRARRRDSAFRAQQRTAGKALNGR